MVTGAVPVDVNVTGCVDARVHRHVAERQAALAALTVN